MTVSEIVAEDDSEEDESESEECISIHDIKDEFNEFMMKKPDPKEGFQVKTKLMLQLINDQPDASGDDLDNSFGDLCSEDETSSEEEEDEEECSEEEEESPPPKKHLPLVRKKTIFE